MIQVQGRILAAAGAAITVHLMLRGLVLYFDLRIRLVIPLAALYGDIVLRFRIEGYPNINPRIL